VHIGSLLWPTFVDPNLVSFLSNALLAIMRIHCGSLVLELPPHAGVPLRHAKGLAFQTLLTVPHLAARLSGPAIEMRLSDYSA
jgi:hypothetical protein